MWQYSSMCFLNVSNYHLWALVTPTGENKITYAKVGGKIICNLGTSWDAVDFLKNLRGYITKTPLVAIYFSSNRESSILNTQLRSDCQK